MVLGGFLSKGIIPCECEYHRERYCPHSDHFECYRKKNRPDQSPDLRTGLEIRRSWKWSLVSRLRAAADKTQQGSITPTHGASGKSTQKHPPIIQTSCSAGLCSSKRGRLCVTGIRLMLEEVRPRECQNIVENVPLLAVCVRVL